MEKAPVNKMASDVSACSFVLRSRAATSSAVPKPKTRAPMCKGIPTSIARTMPPNDACATASPMKARPRSIMKVPTIPESTAMSETPANARTMKPN